LLKIVLSSRCVC